MSFVYLPVGVDLDRPKTHSKHAANARVFIKKQTHKIHIEEGQGFVSFQCATAEKKGTIVIMSKNMLPTRVAWHAKKYGK